MATEIILNSSIVTDNDLYDNGDVENLRNTYEYVPLPSDGDFLQDDLPNTVKVILGAFYSVFGIGAFLGNAIVLIMIVTNRSLRTVTNTFILSLTVSDIIISCWNMPLQLMFHLKNEWTHGQTMCKMTSFVQGISIATSIFALSAISVERYHVICNPIKARFIRSTRSAMFMVLSIWLLAIIMMLPQLWIQRIETRLLLQPSSIRIAYLCVEYIQKFSYKACYSFWNFLVFYVLPVIVMTYAYGKMAKVLWMRSHIGEQVISSQLSDKREIQRRSIIRMLMIIVLCYIICWLPFFTMYIVLLFIEFKNTVRIIQAFALLSGYSNPFINPCVYFFLNAKFKRVFRKRCFAGCKPSSKETHIPLKPLTQVTQT